MNPCRCEQLGPRNAPFDITFAIHSRAGQRVLQFAMFLVCEQPRLACAVRDYDGVATGGLVSVRDSRRLARAVVGGHVSVRVALEPADSLPGGALTLHRSGAKMYFIVTSTSGHPLLFGPVPRERVSAFSRDLMNWHRLLRDEVAAAATEPARA